MPPPLVKQLATDSYLTVCGPVVEYSPALTEEDLLEIIESPPIQGALGAISRRACVGETVSHAISECNDVEAISDLLANPSVQIREETLDSLIEGAPTVTIWHKPLVNRPACTLTPRNKSPDLSPTHCSTHFVSVPTSKRTSLTHSNPL